MAKCDNTPLCRRAATRDNLLVLAEVTWGYEATQMSHSLCRIEALPELVFQWMPLSLSPSLSLPSLSLHTKCPAIKLNNFRLAKCRFSPALHLPTSSHSKNHTRRTKRRSSPLLLSPCVWTLYCDAGNIDADDAGVCKVHLEDRMVRLIGPHSIIGRSIVITAGEDDLGRVRLLTGGSG